jgi:release factor glutamine methyltransferase
VNASIHARVAAARATLRQAGIPDVEADLDARLIAQWLLGWDSAQFFTSAAEEPRPTFQARYDALIARRAAREPMAYLFGGREFWGLMFEVTPGILIPRPETEIIVEAALQLFPDTSAALQIADIGTGSGCLAITLAKERPAARVAATDISAVAVFRVAQQNARRHDVESRVVFAYGDLLPERLGPTFEYFFDLIVSNPPYVPEGDRATLQPEVRDYEPAEALFAGPDGLDVIRRLIPAAAKRLKPGGYLVFEIGVGQDRAVTGLISATPGLRMLGLRNDLQGIPRTVVAQRI